MRLLEKETCSEKREQFTTNVLKFLRVLIYVILFLIVIGSGVASKLLLIFIANKTNAIETVILSEKLN